MCVCRYCNLNICFICKLNPKSLPKTTQKSKKISAISCDSDGIDGSENNAGVYFDSNIINKAKKMGLDPNIYLEKNDSYTFFKKLESLIITGPTLTNDNDFRIVLKK